VFENRVPRKIFGLKRDEVTGKWRKLHNEELNDLVSSSNIVRLIKSRRMRWAGHIARICKGNVHTEFRWGKSEGKVPLGRPKSRWKENIKMDLQKLGCNNIG
jgi:hypothetical protein